MEATLMRHNAAVATATAPELADRRGMLLKVRLPDAPRQIASPKIRILIAGERSIFRDGLRKLVESEEDLAIVGEAADGEQALELVKKLAPDVLLLEVTMPRLAGVEVLRRLHQAKSPVRSILLARTIERKEIITALELGARGIFLKNSTTPLLFKSIRSVMAGEHWVARDTIADLVESLVVAHTKAFVERTAFGLTRRELDVLELIVAGQANREIGQQLRITGDTVKHHLTSIFNKTGASNRLELAVFAIHHSVIKPAPSEPLSRHA
jgi:DNA-binding NarL/FixJ family response regulator